MKSIVNNLDNRCDYIVSNASIRNNDNSIGIW